MSDDERQRVLEANRGFYKAFAQRDLAAMETLWARQSPIACVHPGWPPIVGREPVLASWRGILGNPTQETIVCSEERVLINGDTAVVLCTESIAGSLLIATNVFVREDEAWRLAHHHSGPMPPPGQRNARSQGTSTAPDKRTLH